MSEFHGKIFGTFEADRPYVWKKFHQPELCADSGRDNEELKALAAAFFEQLPAWSRPELKARCFASLCEQLRIEVSPHDFFPAFGCWNRNDRPIAPLLRRMTSSVTDTTCQELDLWKTLNASGASSQWIDYDHSVPDWNYILPLGFPGMLRKIREARQSWEARGELTEERRAFYSGVEITYEAMLALLKRFCDYGQAHHGGDARVRMVVQALQALQAGAPRDTYQVLLFIYLYFMFSEHLDHYQVRSLGNLDNLLQPYVEADLREGRFDEAQIRELLDYFLMQFGAIDNYWGHPLYLGGTDERGESRINRVSYWILEEFAKLDIPTPKIQLKIATNTPDRFVNLALRMIRDRHSSLMFVSEDGIQRLLSQFGCTAEDCRLADIRGCYEVVPSGRRNMNVTAVSYLNFLKPIEWLFEDGHDRRVKGELGRTLRPLAEIQSFEEFLEGYLAHLGWIIEGGLKVGNDFERFLSSYNPSNVFSASIQKSVEEGVDAFHRGCHWNDTCMDSAGLASAVDSLLAVKEIVFERQELSLTELRDCLERDWQGHEALHERVMHSRRKYGNGLAEADALAQRLVRFFGERVNGRANSRGGVWHASSHSARQFIQLGSQTMASPDGRREGEELSKNLSPVQGMDRKGVTALLRSVMSLEPRCLPGDFIVDVMMHPTTVQGDDGLASWRGLLRTYLAHGVQIHFNIVDAGTLRAAQAEPEKYAGLQIRVCGWNVRFTSMPKSEQDMYIRRAENLAE